MNTNMGVEIRDDYDKKLIPNAEAMILKEHYGIVTLEVNGKQVEHIKYDDGAGTTIILPGRYYATANLDPAAAKALRAKANELHPGSKAPRTKPEKRARRRKADKSTESPAPDPAPYCDQFADPSAVDCSNCSKAVTCKKAR
jgi:hypothetical protein